MTTIEDVIPDLTLFFSLIKLAFAAYFIYHFIGWLSL